MLKVTIFLASATSDSFVLCLFSCSLFAPIDNCILNFTQQPVTEIDCDVYQEPVIVLTCSVVSLSQQAFPDPSLIEIRWFFYNGTEYELTNGVGHTRTGGNGDHVQVTSTLNVSGTSDQRFAFLGEGFYYCQVQMTDMTVVANSSQRFQVLSRDEYVQASTNCRERTFYDNVESCAAYEVTTTDSTTSPIPTTTLDANNGDTTTTPQNTSANPTTEPTSTSSEGQGGGSLEVWIYVLVAVAAVFAMIIIILAIMCVGLCLRRSQTMDANSLKRK